MKRTAKGRKIMTDIQKYLNSYGKLCDEAESITEQLTMLKSTAEYRSPSTEAGGRSGSFYDRVGINAAKISDLEAKLQSRKIRLRSLRKDIIGKVSRLQNPRQRRIITDRYIKRKDWNEIASENSICERWMFRLHKQGLEEMTK